MPDGSEFQTAGAATLKPRDAKIVRTRGTDNRLALVSANHAHFRSNPTYMTSILSVRDRQTDSIMIAVPHCGHTMGQIRTP